MNPWSLPAEASFGGKSYPIRPDFRDILEIFRQLNDASQPEFVRWKIALALFYEDPIPPEHTQEALTFLADFLSYGSHSPSGAPKLLDWEQDAQVILADVNKVAGTEIRALPFLHWWTFLSWFHAIGEGQLSTVVAIRSKLAKGKKLESWEREFYGENRNLVDFQKRYSQQELEQRQQIEKMLQ